MPRQELHTDNVRIQQKADIVMPSLGDNFDLVGDREPEIILVDSLPSKDYQDELSFNEEPVTIRLEPSADKNAAAFFPVWVNGKGCEILRNGRWNEEAYIPVGRVITIKRKYVEVIIRVKIDTVSTAHDDATVERPINKVNRFTSAVHSFSVIEDKNPLGVAWLTELRRRNM